MNVYLHKLWLPVISLSVFFCAVCRGGRADHITGGSVSVLPKEGLPQRGLHRYHLLHQLPAWTHHGYQGNDLADRPDKLTTNVTHRSGAADSTVCQH